MRSTHRFLLLAGLCLAVVLGLAWRASAQQGSAKGGLVGVVDVVKLLEEMLDQDEYSTKSKALYAEIESQLTEMQAQLKDLQQELQLMDQSSPDFASKAQQFQAMQGVLQQKAQERSNEYEGLLAEEAIAAYKRILGASRVVADREGYRYVMSSRLPTDQIENAPSRSAVAQQILARPIIAGVDDADLTAMVRAELGLPEPTGDADEGADTDDAGAADDADGDDATGG